MDRTYNRILDLWGTEQRHLSHASSQDEPHRRLSTMNVEEPHYASDDSVPELREISSSDNDSDSEDDRRRRYALIIAAMHGHSPQRIRITTSVPAGLPPNLNATRDDVAARNAARILAGLEHVSPGLVHRLERVEGGDRDCSICLDQLAPVSATAPANTKENDGADPSSPITNSGTREFTPPPAEGVITLPCAHVFHAACLSHWFVQPGQTTCPACRFDLDPAGVIWYSSWYSPLKELYMFSRRLMSELRIEPSLPGTFLHAPAPPPQDDDIPPPLEEEPVFIPAAPPQEWAPRPPPDDDDDDDNLPSLLEGPVFAPLQEWAPPPPQEWAPLPPQEWAPPPPQEWAPPPPPGPTLRDRVEQLERDARLRCCDVSCGVGPSDDNPSVELLEAVMRNLENGSDPKRTRFP
ncbi:hypothetical protein DFH06DRAFT_1306208 [Mycena polygramma]|nr:hypothetical protein DFH06DRAFT_1306208 [Mycena polygramma]